MVELLTRATLSNEQTLPHSLFYIINFIQKLVHVCARFKSMRLNCMKSFTRTVCFYENAIVKIFIVLEF